MVAVPTEPTMTTSLQTFVVGACPLVSIALAACAAFGGGSLAAQDSEQAASTVETLRDAVARTVVWLEAQAVPLGEEAGDGVAFPSVAEDPAEQSAVVYGGAAGVLVNVESLRELRVLAELQQALGLPARVALRVNPDFELKGSGMKMGGGPKQFGIDVDQVGAAMELIRAGGLGFEGFHLFAGSQNLRAESICEAQRKSYELALRLADGAPAPVKFLNLGGGFGIPYFPGEQRLDLAPIGANLDDICTRARAQLPQAAIVIELGRYFVGEAGLYVTRIVDRKVSCGQVFLVCDGGLNHHLSASGNFGQVIRKNYPATLVTRSGSSAEGGAREVASVVGPLCTPLDLLADRMNLPAAEVGDLAVIFQSGAYGASASPQAFLGHPGVTELLV